MLKHAFYDKGLERVYEYVNFGNIDYLRMLEKCGYKKEGFLRRAS